MTNMVPLESSPLFRVFSYGGCSSGGGGLTTEAMMMRETTINNQDSSGETCSVSDPTAAASTDYYNISSSPANKEDGSQEKNDVVSYINIEDDNNNNKSWLRLGIGPEEKNDNNTASYKLQRCCSKNGSGRENSLELSLFSSSSAAAGAVGSSEDHTQPQPQPQPPYTHDQLLTMRGASLVYNQQMSRPPQTLLNCGFSFPSSKPWIPHYTAPFRPSSLGMMSDQRDVTNNYSVIKSRCVEEGGAGPSSEFRVLEPPKRPHSGLWFLLQASQFQEKEPFLPQVSKSYLRITDGRITVRLLIKYLMKKLQLDSESEIEIRCRGQELSPLLTMQHVRDTIWSPKSSSPSFTLLRDSSTTDHLMILHYGRTTA